MDSGPASPEQLLARRARERFVGEMGRKMGELGTVIKERLTELLEQVSSVREMQDRRDAWTLFQSHGRAWEDGTVAAWKQALTGAALAPAPPRAAALTLELVGDDVMENRILASRMGVAMQDAAGSDHRDLCASILYLEHAKELAAHDVLRPDTLALLLVQQWAIAGLGRDILPLVSEVLQRDLAANTLGASAAANDFLTAAGVTPPDDLRSRVRRTESGALSPASRNPASEWAEVEDSDLHAPQAQPPQPRQQQVHQQPHPRHPNPQPAHQQQPYQPLQQQSPAVQSARRGPDTSQPLGDDAERLQHLADGPMVAAMSPLARARRRAQGVLGQLRRVLTEQASGVFEPTAKQEVSATLVHAINRHRSAPDPELMMIGETDMGTLADGGQADVVRAAGVLRERSNELKRQASTNSEKATIEIVALMFQSILAEERIPPSVRVWFARLQLPVLRVALAEPEFFGTLNHPARQLIDRMGSCAMGFDAAAIGGTALEAEIRRVVQVIEQYPETGRRVFQLVYDEFQKFLSKYLTEKGAAQRVVSVAQQIEQKETLAIQYTIELRNMLKDIPVRDEVREFLFKIWAEVLALVAIRKGAQDQETVALKRCAADLVWAASAKPNRADRARVIQSLPQLLQRLRQGMSLLGMASPAQEGHIKRISDTLADAFMSKTEAIPQARIDAMAARLANLEDFVSDESMADMPLDAASIEMMLGIDASSIDVIADAGAKPSDAMMAWAHELHLGHWFTLDHNQKISQVQFAWRSERKQLHLFASMDGRSYLIQAKRLAAYLQAGLLVPQEQEALTLRATRQALEKLDANPERLLAI